MQAGELQNDGKGNVPTAIDSLIDQVVGTFVEDLVRYERQCNPDVFEELRRQGPVREWTHDDGHILRNVREKDYAICAIRKAIAGLQEDQALTALNRVYNRQAPVRAMPSAPTLLEPNFLRLGDFLEIVRFEVNRVLAL